MTNDHRLAARDQADENSRDQELLWPHRQHPDDLVLPDVHPTRFPGTWVAIFEGSLPKDQVNALRVEGFSLYKHIVALPGERLQVIIREEDRPGRDGAPVHEPTQERYDQYEHPDREVSDE
jgi:hypothetical protein